MCDTSLYLNDIGVLRVLMNRPYWKHWQVLAHLTNLTQEDVQSFVNTKLLSNLTLLCLAHGNIDQKTVSICVLYILCSPVGFDACLLNDNFVLIEQQT